MFIKFQKVSVFLVCGLVFTACIAKGSVKSEQDTIYDYYYSAKLDNLVRLSGRKVDSAELRMPAICAQFIDGKPYTDKVLAGQVPMDPEHYNDFVIAAKGISFKDSVEQHKRQTFSFCE